MRHDQDKWEPAILKRNVWGACRSALKINKNQDVNIIDDDFRQQEFLKLKAKVKEQVMESQQKQNEA